MSFYVILNKDENIIPQEYAGFASISMRVSRKLIVSDIYTSVGKALRNLRVSFEGRGLSQAELGRALNIPANTISRWETGTYKPSLEDLEVLARYFGVPIAHLFSEAQPSRSRNLSGVRWTD